MAAMLSPTPVLGTRDAQAAAQKLGIRAAFDITQGVLLVRALSCW